VADIPNLKVTQAANVKFTWSLKGWCMRI